MSITQVSYGRLYNTGNYENIRFEAVASVEDSNVQAAFAEAVIAVHEQYAQWQADREAEAEQARQERQAELQRRRDAASQRQADREAEAEQARQERQAELQRRRDAASQKKADEPIF
jgi:secreted protein with Ig-like and vWFA domain